MNLIITAAWIDDLCTCVKSVDKKDKTNTFLQLWLLGVN